jgi:glycosyltransferase involved in cell wall biosynthesis
VIGDYKKYKFYEIPYPKYESWGNIHSKSPIFAILWNLPLSIYFLFLFLIKRPKLVISNGFSSSLLLAPVVKLTGSNFIVLYHGVVLGFMSARAKRIVKYLSKYVDLVVVNSIGSKNDIKSMFPNKKIVINEHFADDLFFKKSKRIKKNNLNIIYVGSLNREKLFGPLLDIASKLKDDSRFIFTFIGRGKDQSDVEDLSRELKNFKYLGYIGDRKKIKKIYDNSDILWSYADETYLSLPATEALASGLPLIIPKYPGMHQKSNKKFTISEKIVPKKIGWLIDPENTSECLRLIKKLQKNGISLKMRLDCIEYAKKNYSSSNLSETIDRISFYL